MKLHEAKQASSEAIRKSRKNGDRVKQIIREVDEIEGEVQKTIRRFSQRLKRYHANLTKRTKVPPADVDVVDCSEGGD